MIIESGYQRQVVLDTETTGMNMDTGPHYIGHRVIEIGCVEVVNRRLTGRHLHLYLKPDRQVDEEAIRVHGITDDFLADKPEFSSKVDEFLDFIRGAEMVAHNAPFDVGFLDYEMELLGRPERMAELCKVTDTLALARQLYPGKRNNLDVLCDRYGIDNSHRTLHGALLDAEILADVYLLMTGGQTKLNLYSDAGQQGDSNGGEIRRLPAGRAPLRVIRAGSDELQAHENRLNIIEQKGGSCLWRP
ncbi:MULTISPECIES: DNA polymerase III subunit epsilon [Oceanimonas]|uniref:DNA polymerase III subunit epsilon n=1 Tax=Oceanimonas doudoroffii TaxID=84158 RepID=A0A233RIJ0_9GAMM|nr:DNA polymerase III subunit epsilon [Oceanimonas doudoroffii]NHI00202.1 DNA polymerase III subunit epsilon [Oceanimonas sp. MB9]OXY83207.1 DNA polymerase III subunit epsilon [Oceanimonas doudoroffii]